MMREEDGCWRQPQNGVRRVAVQTDLAASPPEGRAARAPPSRRRVLNCLPRDVSVRPPELTARADPTACFTHLAFRQHRPTRQAVRLAEGTRKSRGAILRRDGAHIRGAHLRVGATCEEAHAAQHGAGDLRGLRSPRHLLQLGRAHHLLEPAVDQLARRTHARWPCARRTLTTSLVATACPRHAAARIPDVDLCLAASGRRPLTNARLHRRDLAPLRSAGMTRGEQ